MCQVFAISTSQNKNATTHTNAPGKNAASTKPRKNLVKSAPTKLKRVACENCFLVDHKWRYKLVGHAWEANVSKIGGLRNHTTYRSNRRSCPI